jgi:tetratricopeptide (TPR) repeat protein
LSNSANDPQHLTPTQWQTSARRGARVTTGKQAETLRLGRDTGNAKKIAVDPLKSKSDTVRSFKRLGLLPTVSSIVFFGLLILLGHNCFKAFTYKEHLNSGLVALSVGDPDRAQVEFSLAIGADSKNADAYYYLAQAEAERGSNGNAMKAFESAIALEPNSAKFYQARAALFIKLHNFAAAIEDCNRATKADPTFVDAYRISASAYNHLEKYPESIADATKFIDAYRANDAYRADALAKRAFARDHLRQYAGAIEDYSDAITSDPENNALFAGRAIVYMHSEEWQKGVADCNSALALKPDDAAVFKVRGICNAGLKLHENSLADLNKLVSLHPTVDTHRIRGSQRLRLRDYLGTLEDFDYVLQAEPDDKHTNLNYLRAKIALQKTARKTAAIADAEPRAKMPTAGQLERTEPELVQKGYTLFLSGDPEPAIAYLTAALKINPNDANARRYLAHACVQTDRYSSALKQYAALQQITGLSRLDTLLYAKAFACDGKVGKAVELYNELLTDDPNDDKARTNLITTLLNNGSADEAARRAAEGARQLPSQYQKYNDLFRQALAAKSAKSKLM